MIRYEIELTAVDAGGAVQAIQIGDVTDPVYLPALLDTLTTALLDGLEPGPVMPEAVVERITRALWDDDATPPLVQEIA